MCSLVKDYRGKSKFWTCCYTAADGRQLKRSTRETDKSKARIICEAWEQAESLGSAGLLTSREQLRIVLEQTFRRLTGKEIENVTAKEWLARWLKAEEGAVASTTFAKYSQIINAFVAFLGTRAEVALEAITTDDFLRYRDQQLAEGRAPRTVNITIRKILKRPFQAAVNEGFLKRNPIAGIRHLRDVTTEKGVFTPEQIRRLLDVAQDDWKGLILAGYYTGGRLLDLTRLTWAQVDLEERSISFVQKKTDAKIKVPIHPELEDFLLSRSVPDDGRKPLFPKLYHLRGSGKSGLSSSFRRLMDRTRIDAGIARAKTGKAGRNVTRLSFHSLRHSFVSALANAGVPAELRQKLTGHADAKSHRVYTHHEFETIREALGALGRLPGSEARQ
jgi:integrase